MDRVSSQLTILIRIALPTIMMTVVLSLVVLLSVAVQGRASIFTNVVVIGAFVLVIALLYLFFKLVFWKIYRVDMDDQFLYVSNYFKNFKYPFSDIESIHDSAVLPGRVYIISLKAKGSFGKNIAFLASRKLWSEFVHEHPALFSPILNSKHVKV